MPVALLKSAWALAAMKKATMKKEKPVEFRNDLEDPKMIQRFWLDYYRRHRAKIEAYRRKIRDGKNPRGFKRARVS